MKEDSKPNPQYTNLNFSDDSEMSAMNTSGLGSDQKRKDEDSPEKRLEDKPGAYLLKETAVDEDESALKNKIAADRSDLNEDITAEDS